MQLRLAHVRLRAGIYSTAAAAVSGHGGPATAKYASRVAEHSVVTGWLVGVREVKKMKYDYSLHMILAISYNLIYIWPVYCLDIVRVNCSERTLSFLVDDVDKVRMRWQQSMPANTPAIVNDRQHTSNKSQFNFYYSKCKRNCWSGRGLHS